MYLLRPNGDHDGAQAELDQLAGELRDLIAQRDEVGRQLVERTGCLYVTSPELRQLRDRIDRVIRRRRRLLVEVDR